MAYTKTEWTNDVTPLNADNMNKIEDAILSLQPEALTLKLPANHTISADSMYESIEFSEFSRIGSNISYEDGKIIIGKGINKIYLEYCGKIVPKTSGQKYLSLFKNGDTTIGYLINHVHGVEKQRTEITQTRVLIDVVEGDYFELKVYGLTGDMLDLNRLYITIEKAC